MSKLIGLITVTLLLSIGCCHGIIFRSAINLTEYYSMPPLYSGDDYVTCMIEGDDALWCTAWNIIKPNRSNPTWNTIEKYSNDTKRHYRHDLVQSGICINWCKNMLKDLDEETLASLDEPLFEFNGNYKIDESIFYNASHYKALHDRDLQRCRNLYFTEKYGLRAHSEIVYCYSSLEDMSPDVYDWLFIAVLVSIIAVLTIGTGLDIYINKEQTREHFQGSVRKFSRPVRIALAFSIPRNWYRLHTPPRTQMQRDLRYIQGLRAVTMFLVVYGHAQITYGFAPVTNTEFLEEQYYHIFEMLSVNGMNVVQTFFAISGFLMGVQFFDLTEKRKFNFNYYWVAMFYRYLRLTPVYALVIFFDATWLYKMDHGPFWKTTTETEKSFCRRNWWTNLLYINNYVNPSQPCLIQSWYLAAEFQLFAVCLLVLMVMWKYPKYKKHILYSCLVISYIIPGIITYVREYDGVFYLTPQDKKFIFHPLADAFINFYIPAHTNAGNYFAGLAMAMLYVKYKESRIDISKYKSFVFGFYLIFPIGILSFMSLWLFIVYDFEKPSIWIALYAIYSKNFWGIIGAFLMFGFIGGIGGIIRNFFHMPIFTPIGRIAYCIYLVHFNVFRFLTGDFKALPSVSNEPIMELASAGFFISIFVAMTMCLTLEFPFTALLKEMAGDRLEKTGESDDCEKTINLEMEKSNGTEMGPHVNNNSHDIKL